MNDARATAALVAHEEAHIIVARSMGWEVMGITYSKRGATGVAHYRAPSYDLGDWRELYVTLAGVVSDAREYGDDGDDIERHVEMILYRTKRTGNGFMPVNETDHWKAARILTTIHNDLDAERIERELREAIDEVSEILRPRCEPS